MPALHQPLGDASSVFSYEAFLSGYDKAACSDQDGQHNGDFVYKQVGGDPVTSPTKTVSLSAAMVQCTFSVSQSHPHSHIEPGGKPPDQGRDLL